MALYAIGDIQGCRDAFESLLESIDFDQHLDRLVLVGDLVNRGPDSEGVLRRVIDLGDSVTCVLGNHDLNTLAVAEGVRPDKPRDTVGSLIRSRDGRELLEWLRHRPLMVELDDFVFCHAGIWPGWDVAEASDRAREVEDALRGNRHGEFLASMFGSEPSFWKSSLAGWDRLRFITNAFTRMRFVDRQAGLDFVETGPPGTQRGGLVPWFDWSERRDADRTVVFGHWSSLGFRAIRGAVCLDSGCVWGQSLTAVRLERNSMKSYNVCCKETA